MESGSDHELPLEQVSFIAELRRWRDIAGFSQKALAKEVAYDSSYVSKVERGSIIPSREFAEKADRILRAGRTLVQHWNTMNAALPKEDPRGRHESIPLTEPQIDPVTALVVEHELAVLRYADGVFTTTIRRQLRNSGTEPVTRYMIRIAVDQYPGDPERSNRLYRKDPLTWEEIRLVASCEDEPMKWTAQHDRDAFKEIWLLFENEDGHFPLYPGQTAWIEYRYHVSARKWGPWWQRAIRLPTRRLQMRLDFPYELEPVVWGMETSMSAGASAFRSPIVREQVDDRVLFTWSTTDPPLHGRYRVEWKFRNQASQAVTDVDSPGKRMAAVGIVQDGDPILREPARSWDLPDEAEDVRRVVAELASAMSRVVQAHAFSKGVGLAAPQIGIGRAVALVETPNGERITLINPRVIDESTQTDEQYEGCLSFFDVRGVVPRPLTIEVEHQDVDGRLCITRFEDGIARLVCHEIDHLNGILYRDRMRSDVSPIPVSHYQGSGQTWHYPSNRTAS